MSALVGRKVIIKQGATVVAAGIMSKTLTINKEPIDITSDDDNGFRTLLDSDAGVQSLDISFDGVLKDSDIIAQIVNGSVITEEYTATITGLGEFDGDFALTSTEIGAEKDGAVTFSGSLQSSGQFTFTAAS